MNEDEKTLLAMYGQIQFEKEILIEKENQLRQALVNIHNSKITPVPEVPTVKSEENPKGHLITNQIEKQVAKGRKKRSS